MRLQSTSPEIDPNHQVHAEVEEVDLWDRAADAFAESVNLEAPTADQRPHLTTSNPY